MAAQNSIRSMTATPRRRTTCAFPTSPMTVPIPRPTTAAPGFRCRNCSASRARAASARSRRASSARRPTAAIASPSRPTRRKSSGAAARTRSMPRCWCRTARSATRPSAWWRGIWRRTAFPPSSWAAPRTSSSTPRVPRFLFSDFPLGNSAGKPHDVASQAFTLELALRVLETAPGPQTTVQSPLRWSADHSWKRDYSNAGHAERRRTGAAAPRIRRPEGGRQGHPRNRGVTLTLRFPQIAVALDLR